MKENKVIKVGMADLNTTTAPGILTTLGLGSCVGICLYDPTTKVAGMAHIMLPDSKKIKNNSNKAKFADTAIDWLIEEMIKKGARKYRLVSKIAGGAQMFAFMNKSDMMKIGEKNVIAVKEVLSNLNIPIVAEDTGGNYGRTIEFYSENGILLVKTIGHGIKEL
ncbi:chemotaxis protein CheD [Caminicella sporogenes]|uniref:chemotaxis protein CheD n=1 Tax=Caminicella sporogenes TaxID=166485 RepID=UPI00253F90F4|nr:chemotaxis protein CheD [Caminicella sporogenes]WIF94662.1 chemotaxis protein CheD [Caminicella sporogenes]